MNLEDWLDHCEKLHPHNIDMGLERVQKINKGESYYDSKV